MKNTKLCSTHEERESITARLISTKDDSKLSGGLRRRKMRQKGFWIKIFLRRKKNHPAALINARRKQSSRFALMRSSFHACYSSSASPSACFPWLCHDSIANAFLTDYISDTAFYFWKKEQRLSVKNFKFKYENKIASRALRNRMLVPKFWCRVYGVLDKMTIHCYFKSKNNDWNHSCFS